MTPAAGSRARVVDAPEAVDDDLARRILPGLAGAVGLHAQSARLSADIAEALAMLRVAADNGAPRSSTLTSSGHPLELGVSVDGGRLTGLKCAIDLLASASRSCLAPGTTARAVFARICGDDALSALEAPLDGLLGATLGARDGVYGSVTHTVAGDRRVGVFVLGRADALDAAVLERLALLTGCPDAVDRCRRLMAAFGRPSVNAVGLALGADGRLGWKCYVGGPYIDLDSVRRLAGSLGLGLGHAVSLMRWYRRFIGPSWGRLGAFGFGVDMSGQRAGRLEAYAFPASEHLAAMRRPIDAMAGRRGARWANPLNGVWAFTGAVGTSGELYLAGSSMETASAGRLGRMTINFGVAGTSLPMAPSR